MKTKMMLRVNDVKVAKIVIMLMMIRKKLLYVVAGAAVKGTLYVYVNEIEIFM